MKKIILILLTVLLWPSLNFGQGESNHWYFGYQVGMRFNADGSVTSFGDNVMDAPEGSATASDAYGNLIFYTDGQTIYDRNNQIMQNGTDLITNPTGTSTALIVEKPNDPQKYYVFSVDATTSGARGTGLNYAIVDMSLNNGNGSVIQKQINLLEDCAEKIAGVVKDCATQSLWVITQATETGQRVSLPTQPDFNTLHAFEVTPAGVSTTSVKSTFNTVRILDDRGYIKISPDKTKLASANVRDGLLLYDFDVATGMFSNQVRIHMSGLNYAPYGIEFSPNSRYLYAHASNNRSAYDGHTSELLQYDTQASDITGSGVIIDNTDMNRGALQLANNGKIYRAITINFETGTPYLGVINDPDAGGLAANYVHNGLGLTSGTSSVGLPLPVVSFFSIADLLPPNPLDETAEVTSVCEGESLLLEVQDIVDAAYVWSKDNVVFDNPTRNIYRVDIPAAKDEGVYSVTVSRFNETCMVTGEITVTIADMAIADDKILVVCDEDSDNQDGQTSTNLREIEENESFTYAYFLNEEDRINNNSIEFSEAFNNTTPFEQNIIYEFQNEAGCFASGVLTVQVQPKSNVVLDESYIICVDSPDLTITAPEGFDLYRWSKIEGTETTLISENRNFDVTEAGNYALEAISTFTNGNNLIECSSTRSFEVLPSSLATFDDVIVNGTTVEVIVSGEGEYEFSLDDVTYVDNNILQVTEPGAVDIYVRDKNGCGIAQETIEQDLTSGSFPKFFTPNGDNANDFWQFIPPIVEGEVKLEIIRIYNRYGLMVTQIDPKSQGWDGAFNGKLLPSTDYWFKAHFSNDSVIAGNFSLKR